MDNTMGGRKLGALPRLGIKFGQILGISRIFGLRKSLFNEIKGSPVED